jgi:Inositol monophosphatase family
LPTDNTDLYLRLPREAKPKHKAWDHGAGVALIQAAGGIVMKVTLARDRTWSASETHHVPILLAWLYGDIPTSITPLNDTVWKTA